MDNLEKKREIVTDRLSKRDNERLEEAKLRKSDREANVAQNETTDFFNNNFVSKRKAIESELERSPSIPKDDLTDHLDKLTRDVQTLQRFVTDSAVFLTSRDISNSQNVIFDLQFAIKEKRDELIPKKKFAFKSKKKDATEGKPTDVPVTTKKKINVDISDCNFSNRESETLEMDSSKTRDKDIALSSLTNCSVKLFGSPNAIHIDKLVNCTVYSGPVSGSIFIDDCKNCTFILPCQQLRIHNTTETTFYIHVTSKAIIEDCARVSFAPYTWSYKGIDGDYSVSGLDVSVNNWSEIDDFNWLASDKKSPNWDILPTVQRKQFVE